MIHLLLMDMLRGPATHLAVAGLATSADLRKPVKRVLKGYGVDVWGFLFLPIGTFEYLSFSVKRSQARRAVYALEQNDIPILSAPAWLSKDKQLSSSGDWLDRIIGALGIDSLFR